jgi:hypothetical protein
MEAVSDDPPAVASGPAGEVPWYRRVGPKMIALWRLKLTGILVLMTAFFAAYILVLRFPIYPVTVMPVLGVDRLIGFQPWTLGLYLTLWCYIPLAPLMLVSRRELRAYALAAIALSLAGLAIFLIWPTQVALPAVVWGRYPGFVALKAIDHSGNACPSLHAAFAVFSAIELGRELRRNGEPGPFRVLNWLWCLGILYATLATKQHVVLDLLAGAALGWGTAVGHRLTAPRPSATKGL